MLFNSWGYLLFLAVFVGLHWVTSRSLRMAVLAVGSILFYGMWRWEFCFLMVFSACVDYVAAQKVASSEKEGPRKAWLLTSLVTNLGLLLFFKYTYFVHDNIRFVASAAGWEMTPLADMGIRIILPLGISFYTFQTISYTIDVYRRVIEPTRDFLAFLTYVTFWPQLIAGPVLRAGEVLPQLEQARKPKLEDLTNGCFLILIGTLKKVLIADNIAPFVDGIFAQDVATFTAFDVWVAAFLFGFQIYCDFSGYSDVAIGSARILGIHFPDNFNWPYMAKSPRDFWKRWHISLSAWIRDYLYLPLTGREFRTRSTDGIAVATESGGSQATRALFLTWFIMGLWHGAGWTFALWGVYHAGLVYMYRQVSFLKALPRRQPAVAWGLMLALGMAGWIPFRAVDIRQSVEMFSAIMNPLRYGFSNRAVGGIEYATAASLVVGMLVAYGYYRASEKGWITRGLDWPLKVVFVAFGVFAVLLYLRPVRQFIYFQF